MNGEATLYEIANGGNGHMVQIVLTVRMRRLEYTASTFTEPDDAKVPISKVPAAISIPALPAIPIPT